MRVNRTLLQVEANEGLSVLRVEFRSPVVRATIEEVL